MVFVVMEGEDTGMSRHGVPIVGEMILQPDELRHCRRVHTAILDRIRLAGGWIGFDDYMEFALYAAGLGYYSAGARKFGSGGDFTTAPQISRLFGGCIAKQCAEVFDELGVGSILEVGAGTGQLAVDVLMRLEALGRLPERYFILELSADLQERQQRRLAECVPHLQPRLRWLDTLPPGSFDGVIVANEVLDALPVQRFRWHASGCEEMGVAEQDGALSWAARPASLELRAACERLAAAAEDWPDGYVSEYCPRLKDWTAAVVASLRRGVALWIDYGLPRRHYYLAERRDGTLICHFRQRAHADPFLHPGLQDISAWVDFTALAEACEDTGFELAGFATQAFFLAGLGIDEEMRWAAGGNATAFALLANQAKCLMLPGEMGESFKAMAWARGLERELSGFALQDLRHTL
jgi:SAM-dependent MidA family methyltransferase